MLISGQLWAIPDGLLAVLAGLSTAAMLVGVRYGCWVSRVLSIGPLMWLGRRSYGVYLWHMPLLAFLMWRGGHGRSLLGILVALGLTVLFAALSYRFLEQRFWTPPSMLLRQSLRNDVMRIQPESSAPGGVGGGVGDAMSSSVQGSVVPSQTR